MKSIYQALTYSAVASTAAAGVLARRGEVTATLAVALLAVVALGVRIGHDRSLQRALPSPRLPARGAAVRVGAALLLVSAAMTGAVGPSAVEPAAAMHQCGGVEQLAAFSVGSVGLVTNKLGLTSIDCLESHRAEAINQMQQIDKNETQLSIYQAAVTSKSRLETTKTTYQNYLNDTESAAWMRAEMEIAEAYKNGSSKAIAKTQARKAIAEYYAKKQINLIQQWNTTVVSTWTLEKQADTSSNVSNGFVDARQKSTNSEQCLSTSITGNSSSTVTLVNSSTVNVRALSFSLQTDPCGSIEGATTITKTINSGLAPGGEYGDVQYVYVQGHMSSADRIRYLYFADWADLWRRIEQQNSNLQAEVGPFVNSTWQAFQTGKINASDVISRNTAMFRYGVDTIQNDTSLYTSTAALATMGLDMPKINGTGQMTVEYNGLTYHGLVLAQQAPNGSWTVGRTYHTSNITGNVMLVTVNGERLTMNGEFTITSMTAEDGTSMQTVKATKVVYKTSNASELMNKMQQIRQLRAELEEREPKAGGGGTGGSGGGLLKQLAAVLGVSVGVAAVIVLAAGVLVVKIYSPN
ncbi:hypothetical protein [Halobaculum sp. D14]|uniref:hypothetical protein n=1 Tax=Halobaculum sp. D14 TaxID=3421642 RepID=UPI003EB7A6C6